MSLPAGQQRVLDSMERALQASEPHMASMYAIFARLHEGTEPTGAEPLKRRRRRRPQSGPSRSGRGMYAMALIPVMFIMVVAGVLLGGSAHGLTTCGSGSAAFGGSPWVTRSSCRTSGQAPAGQATSGSATTGAVHGAAVSDGSGGSRGSKDPRVAAALSGTGLVGTSCAAVALTVRAAARTGVKPPFAPPGTAAAGTRSPPAMCY
ncbi:MAG: hypothetical protein ACRDPY_24690 [Streptosporangiaceae bacterium]